MRKSKLPKSKQVLVSHPLADWGFQLVCIGVVE